MNLVLNQIESILTKQQLEKDYNALIYLPRKLEKVKHLITERK